MDAARQVLGDLANAPVISELLAETPGTTVQEFVSIADMFKNVPASQQDYTLLKGMLNYKRQQAAEGQNGVQYPS